MKSFENMNAINLTACDLESLIAMKVALFAIQEAGMGREMDTEVEIKTDGYDCIYLTFCCTLPAENNPLNIPALEGALQNALYLHRDLIPRLNVKFVQYRKYLDTLRSGYFRNYITLRCYSFPDKSYQEYNEDTFFDDDDDEMI